MLPQVPVIENNIQWKWYASSAVCLAWRLQPVAGGPWHRRAQAKKDRKFRIRLESPAKTTNSHPGLDEERKDDLPEFAYLSLEAQEGGGEWRIMEHVKDEHCFGQIWMSV